jgi:hypothetical protein
VACCTVGGRALRTGCAFPLGGSAGAGAPRVLRRAARGHFGRAKTGSLVRRLTFWVEQDVAKYVRMYQTCERTKAEHGGPRGLLPVRERLAAAQQERQEKLDAGRVDTVFKVGNRVLLRTKDLLDAADIGKLRPRWEGPFAVTACSRPNAYTLALPRKMLCSPTVDRLKPFHPRADDPPAPGPVSDPGQEG